MRINTLRRTKTSSDTSPALSAAEFGGEGRYENRMRESTLKLHPPGGHNSTHPGLN